MSFRHALALTAGLTIAMASPLSAAAADRPIDSSAATARDSDIGSALATPERRAVDAADRAAASGYDSLRLNEGETYQRVRVVPGAGGLFYVNYERTYRGLPVIGGEALVVADGAGAIRDTKATPGVSASSVSTTPVVSSADAAETATRRLPKVDKVATPRLVITTIGPPRLAYEVVVTGHTATKPATLHVLVDAQDRAVLGTGDTEAAVAPESPSGAGRQFAVRTDPEIQATGSGHVRTTGTGFYSGTVTIDATRAGDQFVLSDPSRPGLSCLNTQQNGKVFTGNDSRWGNGTGNDLETACVDATYAAQREWDMLRDWIGRDGTDGLGHTVPSRVGFGYSGAYSHNTAVDFGITADEQRQATGLDVVAHEYGHQVYFHTGARYQTPSPEYDALNESTADIFATLTEHYANNPLDTPDYEIGEQVGLSVAKKPLRYMYDPAKARGYLNCYSPTFTNHYYGGAPHSHWFYLLAEGSNPTNGNPVSPTCNKSTVTGIGIQKAGKLFYNGLLKRNKTWSYQEARKATLEAAVSTFPGSCVEFTATRAAWNAIGVPTAAGEPTDCTAQSAPDFSFSLASPSGTVLAGESLTSAVTTWTTRGASQAVAVTASGLPAGVTATVTPSPGSTGATATLTFATSGNTAPGTYQVRVAARGTIEHSLTYTLTVTGNPRSFTNDTPVPLDGPSTVLSPLATTATGTATSTVTVDVSITHPCAVALELWLLGPSGRRYNVPRNGEPCDTFETKGKTYRVPVKNETASGTWTLRVDRGTNFTGTLNRWSITV